MTSVNGNSRLIEFDPAAFDPWRVTPVKHRMAGHPLLERASLVELAKRLEERGRVRTHSDTAQATTSFNDAPKEHPNTVSVARSIENIEGARAWMSLLNVQTDPVYRELIDAVLDDVKPVFDEKDPGMCYRGGWIFVTSPKAVTPFHMDHEHNFILQILGKKRLYVWDPWDRSVVPERGQELFHSYQSRELVKFSEELREKALVFDLEPGQGAFMPSTSPHLVENGDNASITISFTFYTDSTRRRSLVYRGNTHLRRLGLAPRPFGRSTTRDELVYRAMRAYAGTKDFVRQMLGKEVHSSEAPYAFHLTS
jgi:hypothetical protein